MWLRWCVVLAVLALVSAKRQILKDGQVRDENPIIFEYQQKEYSDSTLDRIGGNQRSIGQTSERTTTSSTIYYNNNQQENTNSWPKPVQDNVNQYGTATSANNNGQSNFYNTQRNSTNYNTQYSPQAGTVENHGQNNQYTPNNPSQTNSNNQQHYNPQKYPTAQYNPTQTDSNNNQQNYYNSQGTAHNTAQYNPVNNNQQNYNDPTAHYNATQTDLNKNQQNYYNSQGTTQHNSDPYNPTGFNSNQGNNNPQATDDNTNYQLGQGQKKTTAYRPANISPQTASDNNYGQSQASYGASNDPEPYVPASFPDEAESEDERPETPPEGRVLYNGAQVWNVLVDERPKLIVVSGLTRTKVLSSWGGNHSAIDFMIKRQNLGTAAQILRNHNIKYSVVIEDLQRNIDQENPITEENLQNKKGHRMTWRQYHRLNDIHGYLDYLAKTYPQICSVISIGSSHEGRELKMLKISDGKRSNKAVLIDGGIHAREWISPAVVTYIINEFVENYDTGPRLVRDIDWYIIPVLNPDGYEYSHTKDRLWRKNRHGYGTCSGADLNRNFGYKWGGQGTSKNPCSEVFPGHSAFSEPESRALRNFVETKGVAFKLYATYHSYGEYILYPWGYDRLKTEDDSELERVAYNAARAIVNAGGSPYRVGVSSVVLYPASGGSDDWAKSKGIKYSYTIELSDKGRYGFVLPATYIEKVGRESKESLLVMAEAASHA